MFLQELRTTHEHSSVICVKRSRAVLLYYVVKVAPFGFLQHESFFFLNTPRMFLKPLYCPKTGDLRG